MKRFECSLNELDQLMKLIKHENYLAARLHTYMEYQKVQLDILEKIKLTAKFLHAHKGSNPWWKQIDPEIKKAIERYGG